MKTPNTRLVVLVMIVLASLLAVAPAFARAGGGKGGGGAALGVFGLIVYASYYAIWRTVLMVKRLSVANLLDRLAAVDGAFSQSRIHEMVESTYFAAQNAWTNNNLEAIRHRMSPELFTKWQNTLAAQTSCGHRNILADIELHAIYLIGVSDHDGWRQDRVTVLVHGSMVDFVVHEDSQTVICAAGQSATDAKKKNSFWERWTLSRDGTGAWVLAAVSEDAGITAILQQPNESTDRRYLDWAAHHG